jgi:hypothetical protein
MLEISIEEKEIIQKEIEILSKKYSATKKANNEFEKLLRAIENQNIEEAQLPVLGQVLELLLTSGKVRKNFGFVEEQKILRLYGKTPAGIERKENIIELNKSLKVLQYQKIEDISFSIKLPGVYSILIKTDECEITLNADHSGIYADKLEVEI